MTRLARSGYAQRPMVGIYRLVIIGLMTTYAGIGGIVVISTNMTAVAINGGVSA